MEPRVSSPLAQSGASQSTATSSAEGNLHPAYDAAGVDRSLVRWMLSLTPSERLQHVQGTIDLVRDVHATLDEVRKRSP